MAPTILRRLRLVNYRRYRDAELAFPDGLIGIVGRNGAGKSTLLEAVLWCLYGHDASRTGKDLLRREAAAPAEDVLVRLDFEVDGTAYALTRRLRGKALSAEASLESDGTLLVAPGANSWEQAGRFVEELLGLDRAAFESTVVARQGELAALSDLRPGDRKRLVLGILGIDRVEDAIRACRAQARETEIRLLELRRGLEAEPALRSAWQEAESERGLAQRSLAESEREAELLLAQSRSLREEAEAWMERRSRDQELRARLQALQSRLETVWTQRTRLSAEAGLLRDREAEARALRETLRSQDGLDESIQASEAARTRAEESERVARRVQSLRDDLARWAPMLDAHAENGSSPASLEAEILRVQSVVESHDAHLVLVEADAREATRLLGQLESPFPSGPDLGPEDECPVCLRPLAEALVEVHRRSESLASERAAKRRDVQGRLGASDAERQRLLRQRQADARRLEERRAALVDARRRLRESELARAESERVRAELAEAERRAADLLAAAWNPEAHAALLERRRERDAARDRLARLEEAASRLPRIHDEDRVLMAQEQSVVQERESGSRELRQLGYPAGAWERTQREADAAGRRSEELERRRLQWRERLEARTREAARLAVELEGLEARKQEAQSAEAELRLLEALAAGRGDRGLLPEFKTHLIGRIRPALARAASQLLARMTGGRYAEVVLDDDYAVQVYDGARAHPLSRFSGGEVDVANLALRLAVSELVTNARGRSRLRFVALDEVFGSQDEERRRLVLESLQGLSTVFRQVLVVTHLEDVRDRLEHVVRVEEDAAGAPRLSASWQQKD